MRAAETRQELERARTKETELASRCEQLGAETQDLGRERDEAHREIRDLKGSVAEAEQLAVRSAEAREQAAVEAGAKIASLERDLEQLRRALDESAHAVKTLAASRDAIESEARKRSDDLQEANGKLRRAIDVYRKLSAEWQTRKHSLQAQVQDGAVEIKRVTEQFRHESDERRRAEHALRQGLQRFEEFSQSLRAGLEENRGADKPATAAAEGDGRN